MSNLQLIAVATKRTKDARLGVSLVTRSQGPHTVSSVVVGGLLANAGLVPKTKLTSINNTSLEGLSSDQAINILKDAVGEVTLIGTKPVPSLAFKIQKAKPNDNTWGNTCTEASGTMNASTACESLFGTANVPHVTFQKVYKMVETELLPVAVHGYETNLAFHVEMDGYTEKQMVKGMVGFGTESSHEKKVLLMTSHLATLDRNIDLVATQVKDKVNAMLSKHGIMATYDLEKEKVLGLGLHKSQISENDMIYIVGLEFHLIE